MKKAAKIFLCVILTALLCSCSDRAVTLGAYEVLYPESAGDEFHTLGSVKQILSGEYLTLSLDEKTLGISVGDKTGGKVWTSLPDKGDTANQFSAELLLESGERYSLNTQDNCAALSQGSYELDGGSLYVRYVLTLDGETAKKQAEELESGDVYFAFTAVYALEGQTLTVSVDMGGALLPPGAAVTRLSFLPYFAGEEDGEGDYFLIPDESGAVMRLDKDDAATDSVCVCVYGTDNSFMTARTATARLPAFGVKRSDNAFAAIITQGDALAQINASRAGGGEYSKISADFYITPYSSDGETGNAYRSAVSYTGTIEIKYKFLSSGSDNYIGMAKAVREELLHEKKLPSSADGGYSLFVTLVGLSRDSALTGARQAVDILSALGGKGIDSLTLNYRGVFSGGTAQKSLYSSSLDGALGEREDFLELKEYAATRAYTLLADISPFTACDMKSSTKLLKALSGEYVTAICEEPLAEKTYAGARLASRIGVSAAKTGLELKSSEGYAAAEGYTAKVFSPAEVLSSLTDFSRSDVTELFDGMSVSNTQDALASGGGRTRQENMEIISTAAARLASNTRLSVSNGSLYLLSGASHNSDMRFNTRFYNESDAYAPVPFAQAVLHGSMTYSGEAIDAADPLYRYDMLQCVEYGALPSFTWVYDESSVFCYNHYLLSERIDEFSQYYKKAYDALGDLINETITAHEAVTENSEGKTITGVYMTEYSSSARIYVNYTGSIVITPGNVVIGPYDFVRVD